MYHSIRVVEQFVDYIQQLLENGYSKEQIRDEFNTALIKAKEAVLPPSQEEPEQNVDFKNLSASQILLYLGGLIVVLAGIIYIGTNWQQWGSAARIIAILLPMLVLYSAGIPLWKSFQHQKQAIVFITTGSLLFPLFLSVTFKELGFFAETFGSKFNLTVSFITFGLYLLLNLAFRYPIWSFLYSAAGLFVYYNALRIAGIGDLFEDKTMAWAFLLPGVFYLFVGYYYESKQGRDYSKYPYFLGVFVIFLSLLRLATDGSLLTTFTGDVGYKVEQSMVGWSAIIVGLAYLLIGWLGEKLRDLGLEEGGRYTEFFNLLGALAVLGAILYLGTDGKKPVYETLLLLSSLGFIFASIPKLSRQYLYAGTLFLVIYIFSIGGEYFQNQVGWPITLFIAGLTSMGVGFSIGKLKHQYFST